jgi:hypothetical protein
LRHVINISLALRAGDLHGGSAYFSHTCTTSILLATITDQPQLSVLYALLPLIITSWSIAVSSRHSLLSHAACWNGRGPFVIINAQLCYVAGSGNCRYSTLSSSHSSHSHNPFDHSWAPTTSIPSLPIGRMVWAPRGGPGRTIVPQNTPYHVVLELINLLHSTHHCWAKSNTVIYRLEIQLVLLSAVRLNINLLARPPARLAA